MPKQVVTAPTDLGRLTVEPTFVQRAGLRLAVGVGALIAIVTVCVMGFLYVHYPTAPNIETLKLAQADSRNVLDQYKEVSGIAVKSAQDIFQTIVMQALLPVFTLILGYIFGKAGKD